MCKENGEDGESNAGGIDRERAAIASAARGVAEMAEKDTDVDDKGCTDIGPGNSVK